jgi:branched-chain amino acid transport system ATP-binding protein
MTETAVHGANGMTPAVEPLLSVEDASVDYALVRALFGVSLSVRPGEMLAVLGPNGAGKSTLARALSGLIPLSRGKVMFAGDQIAGWSPHRIRQAGLVHIPEGRGIFPGLTVEENVRMAVRRVGSGAERSEGVERAYRLFPVLGARRRQRAGSLSGGEQQMLSLARALAVPPRLVIADEMSLGLAPIVVDAVFAGIDQARREGVTVIVIEQFVHRVLALADSCVILNRGHLAWSGPASSAHQEVLDQYLGEGESL